VAPETFGNTDAIPAKAPPIEFTVAGLNDDDEKVEFTFRARGTIPIGALASITWSPDDDIAAQTISLLRYVGAGLLDEDRDKFVRTMDRQDLRFDPQLLMELADYLTEAWTGKKLRSRSARRAGAKGTGSTSRVASSGTGSGRDGKTSTGGKA